MRHWILLPMYVVTLSLLFYTVVSAKEEPKQEDIYRERMQLYLHFENVTVPWYYLAAVDQFERNIQQVRTDIPKKEGPIAIQFSEDYWTGPLNPDKRDTLPESIAYFNGNGLDGNGDGLADFNNAEDVLYTMATYLSGYGQDEEDFELAILNYYKREDTVKQILTIAKLYKHFETLDLNEHAFPVPTNYDYSYRGNMGCKQRMGWQKNS